MLKRVTREKGDTIVEVLFAISIFSMIVVMALSLMNQGTATARRTFEIAQVREQIDSQAEALRFLHESYITDYRPGITYNTGDSATTPAEEYYKIIQKVSSAGLTAASPAGDLTTCPSPAPSGSFAINSRMARVMTTTSSLTTAGSSYAQVTYPAGANSPATFRGVWIEGIRSGGGAGTVGFIDFHIRACWRAVGVSVPLNLATIVRLYEPRS
jgi:type II secretory pathway pseudopilin PulG